MWKMLLVLILSLFVVGCSGCSKEYKMPSSCEQRADGSWDSLIWDHVPFPVEQSTALQIVNVQLLKKYPQIAQAVYDELVWMREFVDGQPTWTELVGHAVGLSDKLYQNFQVELLIVTAYAAQFQGVDIPLNRCDMDLVLRHLDKQIIWTSMYLVK
jgi:hypothetical protein